MNNKEINLIAEMNIVSNSRSTNTVKLSPKEIDQSGTIDEDMLEGFNELERKSSKPISNKGSAQTTTKKKTVSKRGNHELSDDDHVVADEREFPVKVYTTGNVKLQAAVKLLADKDESKDLNKKKIIIDSSNDIVRITRKQPPMLSPTAVSKKKVQRNSSAKTFRGSLQSPIHSNNGSTCGSTRCRNLSRPRSGIQQVIGETDVLWEKTSKGNAFYLTDKGLAGKGISMDAYKRYFCGTPTATRSGPERTITRGRIRDFTSQIGALPGSTIARKRAEIFQLFSETNKKITDISKYSQASYYQQISVSLLYRGPA